MKKQMDPFKPIKEELSKYSIDLLYEFGKLFPCPQKNYYLPYYKTPKPTIILKGRSVGMTTLNAMHASITWNPSYLFLPKNRKLMNIYCASANEFWSRWNRFKNLKAFL